MCIRDSRGAAKATARATETGPPQGPSQRPEPQGGGTGQSRIRLTRPGANSCWTRGGLRHFGVVQVHGVHDDKKQCNKQRTRSNCKATRSEAGAKAGPRLL